MAKLECRVVIKHRGDVFDMGMYDPRSGRYEALGTHPADRKVEEVHKLKEAIERAGHTVTFSETRA